ncbi:MAG: insulinase family protein, partial [Pyrinomonadaceae bacterium]|nr:insulinase family protein [Pyrinomonadaceae bacterium]
TLFIFIFSISFATFAQIGEPRQESLLNGLKLLTWTDAKAEKTTVRIRIHSGSAFDPKDRVGMMALLSDIFFPTDQTKEFFEQDLDGNIEVTSNYDYIQITATAKSDDFLTVLEILSTAITNLQITPDNFAKVRSSRLKLIQELQKNPSYVADKLVAKRLLGDFPYGRPMEGTIESLNKIDKPDLIFARDRFLTADNATIAVITNSKQDFVLRAVKRYFGGWRKNESKIPASFALPDEPTKNFLEKINDEKVGELRYAMRGLARNDKDFFASQILLKAKNSSVAKIQQESNILPSLIIFSLSNWNVGKISMSGNSISLPADFYTYPIDKLKINLTQDEFDKAKAEVLTEFNKKSLAEMWIDVDTFRLTSVKDELQKLQNVTLADTQRVAERLTKQSVATLLMIKPIEQNATN